MSRKQKGLPQIVLFGDSLTEWSFDDYNRGFGWALENKYHGKAEIINEGYSTPTPQYESIMLTLDFRFTSSMLRNNFRDIIQRATEPSAAPTLLITIFLGANDACLLPLRTFEENIRKFVDDILNEDRLLNTKVVLITTPPINIPESEEDEIDLDQDLGLALAAELDSYDPKEGAAYKTYMSKKKFAEKTMEIATSYEGTSRIVGLDLWKALIDAALRDQMRLDAADAYDDEKLPGCGLKGAKAFKQGYFSDGLHFEGLAYDVLTAGLLDVVLVKWPELAPERVET
ncbi:SGNH hydrolase [Polyplosphaeria fusca]|uniref:SGNH hydrolase n=1 Tax=Polyplosphaeria fusca TaxID=682080 RepID=A0A9P4R8I9_9PLEO|nr:SGNH hydrolase [Polyplosphaeria fusca]